jgi:hypothetical protein
MAKENRDWGCDRIAGALAVWGTRSAIRRSATSCDATLCRRLSVQTRGLAGRRFADFDIEILRSTHGGFRRTTSSIVHEAGAGSLSAKSQSFLYNVIVEFVLPTAFTGTPQQ